ncbi:MAG: glutamate formimidoyltransferase [Chloroflexi bacterium]|nr:glutamate formimidoyltransferase [Chloroflexota bacterium]
MNSKNVLVECIPNFSEGRRPRVIKALHDAIIEVKGLKLLDYSSDQDHNRCVFTFMGNPRAVKKAVLVAADIAIGKIDMEKHSGAHPRIGAIDVIPIVPICNISIEECVELAKDIGKSLANKYNLPIYLYEAAATRPERVNLADIRKGNYEGLKTEIHLPERYPDFGPAEMHPTAGATVVGARNPLIAFNVNLGTSDLAIAKQIARRVRNKNGGLRYVKAMGVMLQEKKIAQVSMNLTDFTRTPIYAVMEMIKMEARRYGVSVVGSEIIGLLPQQAILDTAAYYLQLPEIEPIQILENYMLE